jgi:hypothetical protein
MFHSRFLVSNILISSIILLLQVRLLNKPPAPVTVINGQNDTNTVVHPILADVPGLPYHTVMSDGTCIIARAMRPEDIQNFYLALIQNASSGYGVDELPSLSYFIESYINGWQNVVFELADTGEIVAYSNAHGSTPFSRSAAAPVIVDGGNFIFMEKFRGKRWFVPLMNELYELMLSGEDGIIGYQGDTAVTNIATFLSAKHADYRVNGVLPRGIFLRDKGWVDLMLYFKRIPNDKLKRLPSFSSQNSKL